MKEAVLAVADDSGYCLTTNDLDFLGISEESAASCVARAAPLGMSPEQYAGFITTLIEAIRREGFVDVDIRLQGSSVKFFSGPHKSMPYTREQIFETYLKEHGERPDHHDIQTIDTKLRTAWPNGNRPVRRPFDALYVTGISSEPSDYDVQLSSDDPFRVISEMLHSMDLNPQAITVENSTYQFMRKEFSDREFFHLQRWAAKWWKTLNRPVNIAIFDRNGPKVAANEALSSHFKETDWIAATLPPTEDSGDARKAVASS